MNKNHEHYSDPTACEAIKKADNKRNEQYSKRHNSKMRLTYKIKEYIPKEIYNNR